MSRAALHAPEALSSCQKLFWRAVGQAAAGRHIQANLGAKRVEETWAAMCFPRSAIKQLSYGLCLDFAAITLRHFPVTLGQSAMACGPLAPAAQLRKGEVICGVPHPIASTNLSTPALTLMFAVGKRDNSEISPDRRFPSRKQRLARDACLWRLAGVPLSTSDFAITIAKSRSPGYSFGAAHNESLPNLHRRFTIRARYRLNPSQAGWLR